MKKKKKKNQQPHYLISLFARTDELERPVPVPVAAAVRVPGRVPVQMDDQTRFRVLLAVVHVHGGRQHRGPVLARVVHEQYLLALRQRAVLAGRVLDRVRRHVHHLRAMMRIGTWLQ